MQKFNYDPPKELIDELSKFADNSQDMCKEMLTEAGNAVLAKAQAGTHSVFKHDADKIASCAGVTKVYETPSDGAMNVKVGFWGYFTNRYGKKTPAPLVANVMEYGSSTHHKHPFFRKCFRKSEITKSMEAVQAKYLPKE